MPNRLSNPELRKSPATGFRIYVQFPIQLSVATPPLIQERFNYYVKNLSPKTNSTKVSINLLLKKFNKTEKQLDNYLKECLYKYFDIDSFSHYIEEVRCEFILANELVPSTKKIIKDHLIFLKNKKRGENGD